jgi:hypothetical protein
LQSKFDYLKTFGVATTEGGWHNMCCYKKWEQWLLSKKSGSLLLRNEATPIDTRHPLKWSRAYLSSRPNSLVQVWSLLRRWAPDQAEISVWWNSFRLQEVSWASCTPRNGYVVPRSLLVFYRRLLQIHSHCVDKLWNRITSWPQTECLAIRCR